MTIKITSNANSNIKIPRNILIDVLMDMSKTKMKGIIIGKRSKDFKENPPAEIIYFNDTTNKILIQKKIMNKVTGFDDEGFYEGSIKKSNISIHKIKKKDLTKNIKNQILWSLTNPVIYQDIIKSEGLSMKMVKDTFIITVPIIKVKTLNIHPSIIKVIERIMVKKQFSVSMTLQDNKIETISVLFNNTTMTVSFD